MAVGSISKNRAIPFSPPSRAVFRRAGRLAVPGGAAGLQSCLPPLASPLPRRRRGKGGAFFYRAARRS
jgi:hypothetical protein